MNAETEQEISRILPTIKENTAMQNKVQEQAKRTQLVYQNILHELKRQNNLLERLEKAGRMVTVSK